MVRRVKLSHGSHHTVSTERQAPGVRNRKLRFVRRSPVVPRCRKSNFWESRGHGDQNHCSVHYSGTRREKGIDDGSFHTGRGPASSRFFHGILSVALLFAACLRNLGQRVRTELRCEHTINLPHDPLCPLRRSRNHGLSFSDCLRGALNKSSAVFRYGKISCLGWLRSSFQIWPSAAQSRVRTAASYSPRTIPTGLLDLPS